jgi:hypothetical protein
MNVPRETVSLALYALLSGNAQLIQLCKTITRQPRLWTDVNEAEKPFLTLFKGGPGSEEYSREHAGLTKYTLYYNLWLYITADPTGTVVGESTVNPIADAIDVAMLTNLRSGKPLSPQVGERQTLGGIVTECYLHGGNEWGREFNDNNLTVFWRICVDTGN